MPKLPAALGQSHRAAYMIALTCSKQTYFVPLLQSKFSKESHGAPSILFWKLLNVCGLVLHVSKTSQEKMSHGVQMRHSPVGERGKPTTIELCSVKWLRVRPYGFCEEFMADCTCIPYGDSSNLATHLQGGILNKTYFIFAYL